MNDERPTVAAIKVTYLRSRLIAAGYQPRGSVVHALDAIVDENERLAARLRDLEDKRGEAEPDTGDDRWNAVVSSGASATPGPWEALDYDPNNHGAPNFAAIVACGPYVTERGHYQPQHKIEVAAEGELYPDESPEQWAEAQANAQFIAALANWYFARAESAGGTTTTGEDEAEVGDDRRAVASGAAAMLAEFHGLVSHPDTDALWLRWTLHDEEYRELVAALDSGDRKAIAQELADVVYVSYGTALAADINLDVALAEVHRANMDKARAGVRRTDGKVIKPPGFVPPDMTAAVESAGGTPTTGHPSSPDSGSEPGREVALLRARLRTATDALRRIANADLPPHERPPESWWAPTFWSWAPPIARAALAAVGDSA